MEEVIHKEKFSNQACKYIQDKILSGEYQDGERLVETKVAKELGVSQSPVREALRELEVMGLVEIKPYSGCFVRSVDEKKLNQIYSLRANLETFAAREGIAQITDEALAEMEDIFLKMQQAAAEGNKPALVKYDVEFHGLLVEAAKNSMLMRMWKLVGAPQWTAITVNAHKDILYFPESHRELLALAQARDTEGFCRELAHHFKMVTNMLVSKAIKKQKE